MIEQTAAWPDEDRQELADYARVIEARRNGIYRVSPEERVAIDEGIAEADQGEFADDTELSASRSAV